MLRSQVRYTEPVFALALALQPLLEELKTSDVQFSWKADAGLEFLLANHNYFNSSYKKKFI